MRLINNPEEVKLYRRITCQFYELCLNTAVVGGWNGFTCSRCSAFKPLDETDQRADMEAIARMYNRAHGKDEPEDESTTDDGNPEEIN